MHCFMLPHKIFLQMSFRTILMCSIVKHLNYFNTNSFTRKSKFILSPYCNTALLCFECCYFRTLYYWLLNFTTTINSITTVFKSYHVNMPYLNILHFVIRVFVKIYINLFEYIHCISLIFMHSWDWFILMSVNYSL